MTRRTLLLVSPPVLFGQGWWKDRFGNRPHIASLAGYVRDLAEVRTLALDDVAGAPLEPLLAEVEAALTPDVALVGLSCWTSLHYLGARAVAERVRALAPDVPIVIGGHHATALPDDFDATVCDWVVRGDGERPLRALCEAWPRRPEVMGVLDGGVFDQDDPAHIDWDRYGEGTRDGALWIGASRGCAFKCRFCVEPSRGAAYSRYDVDVQLDLIERLVARRAPRVVCFSDPLFGANRRWLEALLDGLARRELPVMFWAETRLDLMAPALLERFLAARFMVDFGLDTASATMIGHMQKAARADHYLARAREALMHANRIGLPHGVYLVFNFPGETPDTTRETEDFVDSLDDFVGPMSGLLSAATFFLVPGTDSERRLAEHAATHGTLVRRPGWWRQPHHHHSLATDVLPSRAWLGREHELGAFRGWNALVQARWSAAWTPEVRRFREVFYRA
ncbi:MAG: cobalamin-dependent protein [Deltaproteobacteria bacterium]|nr:cobalamin-dependent protein [Deltaproteobacteria bacterium]